MVSVIFSRSCHTGVQVFMFLISCSQTIILVYTFYGAYHRCKFNKWWSSFSNNAQVHVHQQSVSIPFGSELGNKEEINLLSCIVTSLAIHPLLTVSSLIDALGLHRSVLFPASCLVSRVLACWLINVSLYAQAQKLPTSEHRRHKDSCTLCTFLYAQRRRDPATVLHLKRASCRWALELKTKRTC